MTLARRLSLSNRLHDQDIQASIDELREKFEKDQSTGTEAPTSSTPGNMYLRTGASAGIYYKSNGTWTQVANVS